MLSTVMQIQFNWLFVYMLHSAAHGRSLTFLSKKICLPVVFQLKGSIFNRLFFTFASSCTPVAQSCHPICHRLPENSLFCPLLGKPDCFAPNAALWPDCGGRCQSATANRALEESDSTAHSGFGTLLLHNSHTSLLAAGLTQL